MVNIKDVDTISDRLRLFAEIYTARMAGKPYMEIRARYDSMTEAKLEVKEREFAEKMVDTGKLDEILHPENYQLTAFKKIA